ncbi:PTS galactitol transporter subunit IIB [Dermabacter sp. HMSC06F07]|uniref:PTS sugar transporter subunit IIB n=1 Tax=Dermabacter sp. HMSC06F07 TaxID=1581125 RepID=UPI0008A4E793|nr:PTS sugar transporter subunit IIB [Dermabacter sp. HMSC06F07]OFT48641.1 PTS galactitol transporter subunit IIB [Dermabacter sp. HMSC06F07]
MKKVLVVCGTGVATSTVVVSKVRDFLEAEGIDAQIQQGKVMDLVGSGVDADLIVSTTDVPGSVTIPVVRALSLITGMGQEGTLRVIADALS